MALEIENLKVSRGDVIVFRVHDQTMMQRVASACKAFKDATGASAVLVLSDTVDIEALDPEQMRARGWVRADQPGADAIERYRDFEQKEDVLG